MGSTVSRDGRILATGGDEGVIAVRRLDTGRLLSKIKGKARVPVIGVALSPDGRRVVRAAGDGVVTISGVDGDGARRLADLSATQVARYGAPNYATSVSFSRDARRVAAAALDGSFRILPTDGWGRAIILGKNGGQVFDLGSNRSGSRLVTASADDTVRV